MNEEELAIRQRLISETTKYNTLEMQAICPLRTMEFLRGFKFAQIAMRDCAERYEDDDKFVEYICKLILNETATNIEYFLVANDE